MMRRESNELGRRAGWGAVIRRRAWAAIALAAVVAAAPPAAASRAGLEGRGLPPFLAPDPSLIRFFPASAGEMEPMVLVDYSRDRVSRSITTLGPGQTIKSDRFVLALIGRGTRFGYALDGFTHNLILAFPSGWGMVLGVTDRYGKEEYEAAVDEPPTGVDAESFSILESSEREVRLGVSWRMALGGQRTLDLGIGGAYYDRDVVNEAGQGPVGSIITSRDGWASDPGLAIDISVRTLLPGPGFLVAGHGFYQDMNWKPDGMFAPQDVSRGAAIQLGWRIRSEHLDDLVAGVSGSWRREQTGASVRSRSNYSVLDEQEVTRFESGVFLSGERRVLSSLTIRGGILGEGTFEETVTRSRIVYSDSDHRGWALQRDANGSIQSPAFFLGASWSWKALTVDARIDENVTLDTPFVRWAATLKL